MAADADDIVERRRLRRSVSLWRVAAIVIAAAALFIALSEGPGLWPGSQIARVTIDGVIVDDPQRTALLEEIAEDGSVEALILRIDSPGGTTTGSETLFEAVRRVADEKPVVATLGTVAASGGYIAALSADHIVSRGNTITGSIGVIFQWAQVNELLGHIGVEVHDVQSGDLKAEPSPFEDPDPEALAMQRDLVRSAFDWFKGLVSDRRGLAEGQVERFASGRVYTGFQAVDAGLVDEIGGEREALSWLEDEHGVSADLPVNDWEVPEDDGAFLPGAAARLFIALLNSAGLGEIVALTEKSLTDERLTLDGLIVLWHPRASN